MRTRVDKSTFPRHRFPVNDWKLVEEEYSVDDMGLTETVFAVSNGYIGMRANPSEGRDAHTHGTYLNQFHETWPILHAEAAHGFAETGQTLINVPDAKLIKLYIDDEPLLLADADLVRYERGLDFAKGYSYLNLTWRTPGDKLLELRSSRMVCLDQRHLAVMTFEVELKDASAPIVISSRLLNRQDGEDEYHVRDAALGEGVDPRQAQKFDRRVLLPRHREPAAPTNDLTDVILGYRTQRSGMTLACGYRHQIDTGCEYSATTITKDDLADTEFRISAQPNTPIRITKYVAYHTSRGVPAEELADRCRRTLQRAAETGVEALRVEQKAYLDRFWATSDIKIDGDPECQQIVRWHLFQLAQASACTNESGIAAKGTTGGGYDGHYFWDTEIYVIPFLAYTNPSAARKLLRFRWRMLDSARTRAKELSQKGALYPWRTINGEEASAYYAAGTAQYHINAAVAYAIECYHTATGDDDFLFSEGAEILAETARLWEDLGFYAENGGRKFRIHGVTGPDEYTTVVNDNLYTNVMAQFNMRFAAKTIQTMRTHRPDAFARISQKINLESDEVDRWIQAADSMLIPFDSELGIHPQDNSFLVRDRWPFDTVPDDKYPLLLNFHPLVIYRHQVLKQADVVLAMFLQPDHFSAEQQRANFDYYDPLTTGDSSLAACIQSTMAARVGRHELAERYFVESLFLDLVDAHGNTADGIHLANSGGVWTAIVQGFAAMTDTADGVSFQPYLPCNWEGLRIRFQKAGSLVEMQITQSGASVQVLDGPPLTVCTSPGTSHKVCANDSLAIPVTADRP